MINIDLIYMIPIVFSVIAIIGMYAEKINWFVGLIGIIGGFGISYYIAPYTDLIMTPLSNVLWFGYNWSLFTGLAMAHLISIFVMSSIAMYNLYMSNGKKLWG